MLTHFVPRIEEITLDGDDLVQMAKTLGQDRVSFVMYDDLTKYDNLEMLFKDNIQAVYILMLIKSQENVRDVGHWVVLVRNIDQNVYYYYDPYGLGLTKDLALTHESGVLLKLLSPVKYEDSSYRHQAFSEDVNTCGRHCVVRSIFSHLSNKEYDQVFVRDVVPHYAANPDALVSLITVFGGKSDMVLKTIFQKK